MTRGFPLAMPLPSSPPWLINWMREHGIALWGAADLRGFCTPQDETGHRWPFAISWAIPMEPHVMVSIQNGPNQAYADEYARVNALINRFARDLSAAIKARGHSAMPLAASVRTDTVGIKGDFPHKTAATRAGLGWIGRHCQLVTRQFGSWIRLGTVFTDMALPCGPTVDRDYCGRCVRCVEVCPAQALTGTGWYAGIPREELLDAHACDRWKKEHWHQFHSGHVCGMCSAVCPHGLKFLRRI